MINKMDVNYWIYSLSNDFGKHIKNKFIDNKLKYISYSKFINIKKNDKIFFFHRSENIKENGFVFLMEARTDMLLNKDKIEIFTDVAMNRYYLKICNVIEFKNPIKISVLKKTINQKEIIIDKKLVSDKFIPTINQSISTFDLILSLIRPYGIDLEKYIIEINNKKEEPEERIKSKKIKHNNKDKINVFDEQEEENNEDAEIYDKIEVVDEENGKIPILIIPCSTFKLNKRHLKEELRKHFFECDICEKVNNNDDCKIYQALHSHVDIRIELLSNENIINEKISYYHQLKRYCSRNEIVIYKIDNDENMYNKAYLVFW